MPPGHAKLRFYSPEGDLALEALMTAPIMKIGRADPQTTEEQCLQVPQQFNGVSREHLEIKWSETACTFEATVTGRNGAIVNRRRLTVGETALLPFRAVSAIALGKGCLVYFSPAKRTKPKEANSSTPAAITSLPTNSTKVDRPRPVVKSWVAEVMSVLAASSGTPLTASELLERLISIHPELNKKYVRGLFRKAPFSIDPDTGIVGVVDPDSLPIAMLGPQWFGKDVVDNIPEDTAAPLEEDVVEVQLPEYPHKYPSSKRTRTGSNKYAPIMRSPGLER
jgi:hypothetical protein